MTDRRIATHCEACGHRCPHTGYFWKAGFAICAYCSAANISPKTANGGRYHRKEKKR